MKENKPDIQITNKFINRLAQFFNGEGETWQAIDKHITQASDKHDLFRRITEGLGKGKSHFSGKPEGKPRGS